MKKMNDRSFLRYCETHCETPVGAFSRRDMFRLGKLAGEFTGDGANMDLEGFIRPTEKWVHNWVRLARERLDAEE
jgi:hypothetical protein